MRRRRAASRCGGGSRLPPRILAGPRKAAGGRRMTERSPILHHQRRMGGLPRIALGREVTGSLDTAVQREWLVTDGTGSYAMGTVALARTRRYHGLLIAATRPPLGRMPCVGGMAALVMSPLGPDRHLGPQHWPT